MKSKRDLIIYGVALALSIGLWLIIPQAVPMKTEGANFVNSRFFPRVIAVVSMALSALGLALEMIKPKKAGSKDTATVKPGVDVKAILRVLALALVMFLYAIALEPVGFILATVGAVVLCLMILGEHKPVNYLVVLAVCAVIYAIFTFVLKVRLP